MNPDDRRGLETINWWHSIDLGHGITTPGRDNSSAKLKTLAFPESLVGQTVLDVGAWDGFFSFEAERRGAKRVLATDSFCWSGRGWGTKEGFNFARKVLNSNVEDMEIDVLDLSHENVGRFDVVLLLGVLYHVRHPLLALERVFDVTGHQLILETHVDVVGTRAPMMVFYPEGTLGDVTNLWGPNPAAVEAMLRAVGFREVKRIYSRPRAYNVFKAFNYLFSKTTPFSHVLRQGRVVYHAWR